MCNKINKDNEIHSLSVPCYFFNVNVLKMRLKFFLKEKDWLKFVCQETLEKFIWFTKATKSLRKNVNLWKRLKHSHTSLWKRLSFLNLLDHRWLGILKGANWPLFASCRTNIPPIMNTPVVTYKPPVTITSLSNLEGGSTDNALFFSYFLKKIHKHVSFGVIEITKVYIMGNFRICITENHDLIQISLHRHRDGSEGSES